MKFGIVSGQFSYQYRITKILDVRNFKAIIIRARKNALFIIAKAKESKCMVPDMLK